MRLLAHALRQKGEFEKASAWLHRAIAEDPGGRENYIEMGECCLAMQDYSGARYYGEKALKITHRDHSYLVDQAAWTWKPHDLIAIAAYYLGELDTALEYARNACRQEPGDRRLQKNLALVEAAIKSGK
jgi:tetratricopeptide (TPR) repeat protein